MYALGYALAIIIGLTLGLFGGGGSILTVPVFVYVMQFDPKLAIAMSLPVVGITSLVGAGRHWQAGNVRLPQALFFGVFAMSGAFFAARLSDRLEGRVQLFLLGVVMLAASVLMLRDSLRERSATSAVRSGTATRVTLAVVGLGVGALTGTIGVGGGFLIVPSLVLFARIPIHQAVGTSLLIIAMNSAAGFAGQRQVGAMPIPTVIAFTLCAVVGILAGSRAAAHVGALALKRGFAVFLVVIATSLLWQNWPAS